MSCSQEPALRNQPTGWMAIGLTSCFGGRFLEKVPELGDPKESWRSYPNIRNLWTVEQKWPASGISSCFSFCAAYLQKVV